MNNRALIKRVKKDFNKYNWSYYWIGAKIKEKDFLKKYTYNNDYIYRDTDFHMGWIKTENVYLENGIIYISIKEKPIYGDKMIKEFNQKMKGIKYKLI